MFDYIDELWKILELLSLIITIGIKTEETPSSNIGNETYLLLFEIIESLKERVKMLKLLIKSENDGDRYFLKLREIKEKKWQIN